MCCMSQMILCSALSLRVCRIVTLDEILAYGADSWKKGRPLGLYIETKVILLLVLIMSVLECMWFPLQIDKASKLL